MRVMFSSRAKAVGKFEFPEFSGIRVMMMPFYVHQPTASLPPELEGYALAISKLPAIGEGVGYLTVDEGMVPEGSTQRRPGLHVDGMGGWGGGPRPGPWAGASGFYVAATNHGCRFWNQAVAGTPKEDGNCEHLRSELRGAGSLMANDVAYHCSTMLVHESVPMARSMRRQFVRISSPSDAPWYLGYTPNPLGIKPTGPVLPAREAQMGYRP